jgi:hydroxylamine reductase
MFCYQCQETIGNKGCAAAKGACGKDAATAELQDLLIHTLKGIAVWAQESRAKGQATPDADNAVMDGLFATITNANFDSAWFTAEIGKDLIIRERQKDAALAARASAAAPQADSDAATWRDFNYAEKAKSVGVLATENPDVRSLRELLIYGLKGMAAYAHHAAVLGYRDDTVFAFMHKALRSTLNDQLSAENLTGLVLECGSVGVKVMASLDSANTGTYGKPEATKVKIDVGTRPGILISGHDLKDLEMLLEQSKDADIDIYTHSEMLPAHYYPKFKQYKHFYGNYGNAWWKQREEFESFNGVILMTTNCIVPVAEAYKNRIYTTGVTGYPGVPHINADANGQKDFSAIIALAKTLPAPRQIESGTITGGFAHDQVAALAPKVAQAIKDGAIKKFIVMAGCDGRQKGRDYYSDFATALPKDTVILTAGCAKYRYNKLVTDDIDGIPRVLDAGQCNDSYSLALTALMLKDAFGLEDVNQLPIAFNLAWYEQKAVLVLLALLSLGFRDIHVGPTLPAFLSPGVADVLIKTFGLASISTVEEDMEIFGIA